MAARLRRGWPCFKQENRHSRLTYCCAAQRMHFKDTAGVIRSSVKPLITVKCSIADLTPLVEAWVRYAEND